MRFMETSTDVSEPQSLDDVVIHLGTPINRSFSLSELDVDGGVRYGGLPGASITELPPYGTGRFRIQRPGYAMLFVEHQIAEFYVEKGNVMIKNSQETPINLVIALVSGNKENPHLSGEELSPGHSSILYSPKFRECIGITVQDPPPAILGEGWIHVQYNTAQKNPPGNDRAIPQPARNVPNGARDAPELRNYNGRSSLLHPSEVIPWERLRRVDDYSKWTFDYTKVNGRLGEFLDRCVQAMNFKSLREYVAAYIDNPLAVIQRENNALAEHYDMPTTLLAERLVGLHGAIQRALFQPDVKKPKDEAHFRELNNVGILAEGDYLPGHRFVLGNEETYNRELLRISRESPLVFNNLLEAKVTAIRHLRGKNKPIVPPYCLAAELFTSFQQQYAEEQDSGWDAGESRTIGGFMEKGGCCRHRAAALAVSYQEAGIKARYTRGNLPGGGPHAWVLINGENRDIVADPNLGRFMNIGPAQKDMYRTPEHLNTIWRAKVAEE